MVAFKRLVPPLFRSVSLVYALNTFSLVFTLSLTSLHLSSFPLISKHHHASKTRHNRLCQSRTSHPCTNGQILLQQCTKCRFHERILQKGNPETLFLDLDFLRKEGFKFLEYQNAANLTTFLSSIKDIFPELVRVFYCNLRLVDGVLISEVCHKPIRSNLLILGE